MSETLLDRLVVALDRALDFDPNVVVAPIAVSNCSRAPWKGSEAIRFVLGTPASINPRISVSVTSMLTLIAHRFVIKGELPKLPYLTTMDYFLLGSTLMVLLGLIEVVIVHRVGSRGDEAKSLRLNRFFRWSYPLPFLALLVFVLVR